jgi:F-type H+-transporting ATPase subunit delta
VASPVARRYAEAYFKLARDAKQIPQWRDELRSAAETLSHEEVAAALVNPRLPLAQRTRLALDLLDGLSEPTRNLVRLLLERRRIGILDQILEEYDRLADEEAGILRAEVRTAVPVTPELKATITKALVERLGRPVEVTVVQDPEVIGGLIVRVGDRVIDTSIRTQLQQLQAALM